MQPTTQVGPLHGRSLLSMGVGAISSVLIGAAMLLYKFVAQGGDTALVAGCSLVGLGFVLALTVLVVMRHDRQLVPSAAKGGTEEETNTVAFACAALSVFAVGVLLIIAAWFLFQLSRLA